jgi:cellulose synthase/poly-beta-1,6-N-acetylglucosamine synthase-like glycosyltransferase
MLTTALIVFWSSVAVVVFTLGVFPLWTWLRGRWFERPIAEGNIEPTLSVVIACYNEERHIRGRIENLLACDYPREKLEVVVASDGSTDATEQIVRDFGQPSIRAVRVNRGGKGLALNAGVAAATGEVLVFTDANTEFAVDALRALVRRLADPTIGCVAGNQIYLRDGQSSLSADGECLHWSLDTWQKEMQSRGGSATSATGAIYALRASCFDPVPRNVMDDYYISTGAIARGLRIVFAADARAFEPVATKSGVEFSRKTRVATQGLRAVWARRSLLNPLRHGWYAVQAFTHKVLRRLLVIPFLAMMVSASVLAKTEPVYLPIPAGALALGLLAACGYLLRGTRVGRSKLFTFPYFFCMTQCAMLLAAIRTARGQGLPQWEPERHSHGAATTGGAVAAGPVAAGVGGESSILGGNRS